MSLLGSIQKNLDKNTSNSSILNDSDEKFSGDKSEGTAKPSNVKKNIVENSRNLKGDGNGRTQLSKFDDSDLNLIKGERLM